MSKPPVECARGHWNDPYPENGRCVVCSTFLPGNPNRLTTETAREAQKKHTLTRRSQREKLRGLIRGAGYTMETVPELLLMYAETAVRTGSSSDLDKFAIQVEQFKPAPRSREERQEPTLEVVIVAKSIENLHRAKEQLDGISRDRSQ